MEVNWLGVTITDAKAKVTYDATNTILATASKTSP